MKTRILVGIPIVILLLAAIFVQGWLLAAFAILVAVFTEAELTRSLRTSPVRSVAWIPMAFVAFLSTCFVCDLLTPEEYSVRLLTPGLLLGAFLGLAMLSFIVVMLSGTGSFPVLASTVFALVYPAMFTGSFFLLLVGLPSIFYGSYVAYMETVLALLMLFVPPALSDTIAYFWGSRFGRTKIAPVISPKKTVAGSVAGLVGGAVGAGIVWAVVAGFGYGGSHQSYRIGLGLWAYLLMGVVLAVLSQFGDLAASYIKRYAGVKDFGTLLPGHGGVLDRTDSTIFVMPVICLFSACSFLSLTPVN